MNPIKTPREMLFEMLNLPRMAGGKSVEQAFTLADMVKRAIKEYIIQNKKQPSAQEIADLKAYAQTLSQPTSGLRTGQSAVPRAQYELAKDPNLVNPNAPDEFMMQAMLGRGQKGTRLTPKVYDVTDPVNIQRMEGNQLAGAYDDMLEGKEFGNVTPGATFFANRSAALENTALGSGKIPLIDQLKMQFQKQTGRYPNEDELNAIIADYNPMRHQYGPQGVSIVGSRPATAKGGAMETWRQAARNEGIPEKYVSKSPADYPQYLIDELSIQRGQLPGVAPHKARTRKGSAPTPGSTITRYDEQGNPLEVQKFATGSLALSPAQMGWDLAAMGRPTSRFADPYVASLAEERARNAARAAEAAKLSNVARRIGKKALGKAPNIAFGTLGAMGVEESMADAKRRWNERDPLGAALSATGGVGEALSFPFPGAGTAMSMVPAAVNAIRDEARARGRNVNDYDIPSGFNPLYGSSGDYADIYGPKK